MNNVQEAPDQYQQINKQPIAMTTHLFDSFVKYIVVHISYSAINSVSKALLRRTLHQFVNIRQRMQEQNTTLQSERQNTHGFHMQVLYSISSGVHLSIALLLQLAIMLQHHSGSCTMS
jgi:hypothetical protein